MKRFLCTALILLLMAGGVGAQEIPAVSASSAVLMDADSGRILFEQNADDRRPIASTTKLLTALTALGCGHDLNESVTVRQEWTGIEGSSLYLKAGERLTLEELLYGLLLVSGNDAASAVAGFCAGSEEAFVARMNTLAASLGMDDSSFANPSGLDHPDHYSTARDMAVLARACLEQPTLCDMVSTRSVSLGGRVLVNHNKLLQRYEGCIGMKTGYTDGAGRTLVSAARREGMTLICVTLNAPDDWNDHAKLFDYGFARFQRRCLVREGEVLCHLPVKGSLVPLWAVRADRSLWAALAPDEQPQRNILPVREGALSAPVDGGTRVGTAEFSLGGRILGKLDLTLPARIPCDIPPDRWGFLNIFGR